MTFTLGEFTVVEALRPGNNWPIFVVYVGVRLIGRQLSRPSIGDCRWLEQHNGRYASDSTWTEPKAKHRRAGPGRPTT